MDANILRFFNKQSKNIEKILRNYSEVKIVFDRDVDGLMSCLIVYSFLKKAKKKIKLVSLKTNELENFIKKEKNSDKLFIFLDLSLEENIAKEIRNKKIKSVWIDHHQIRVFSSKDILFINPLLVKSNIYIPTSAISYILFDRIYHLEDSIFFACIGIVSDKGERDCKTILEKCQQKYKISISEINEIAMKINSIFVLNKKIERLIPKMLNIEFFTKNKFLDKIYRKAQKIINFEFKKALRKYKEINGFILYKTSSKYNIRSVIANMLSEEKKFSDKIIIVYNEKREVNLSLRNGYNSNINLLEFLKEIKVSYKSFGGHKNACGASMDKKEFKKFLEEIKKYGKDKRKTIF